jgi:hypothetical protein
MNRKYFLTAATVGIFLSLNLLLLTGCTKNEAEEASKSDVNGFLCPSCNEKFYTSVRVYPSYCPKCKKTDVVEVVGYILTDGTVFIGPRDFKGGDPNMSKATGSIKLPRENELKAWGATKRTAQEVGSQ